MKDIDKKRKDENITSTGHLANTMLGDSIISVETFRNPTGYTLNSIIKNEPTSFNGVVDVIKYKITVEIVDEPIEIIHERLQKLWDECDNYHHWTPIREKAEFFNYELKGTPGSNRKK